MSYPIALGPLTQAQAIRVCAALDRLMDLPNPATLTVRATVAIQHPSTGEWAVPLKRRFANALDGRTVTVGGQSVTITAANFVELDASWFPPPPSFP